MRDHRPASGGTRLTGTVGRLPASNRYAQGGMMRAFGRAVMPVLAVALVVLAGCRHTGTTTTKPNASGSAATTSPSALPSQSGTPAPSGGRRDGGSGSGRVRVRPGPGDLGAGAAFRGQPVRTGRGGGHRRVASAVGTSVDTAGQFGQCCRRGGSHRPGPGGRGARHGECGPAGYGRDQLGRPGYRGCARAPGRAVAADDFGPRLTRRTDR